MFIFLRLLLGHLIGDFPLQTDYIFKLKLKGVIGVTVHALIIFFSCILFSWPYLNLPLMWIFVIFILATHLIQDTIKLKFSSPQKCFWSYVIDQVFHAGIISLVLFTSLADLSQPPFAANSLISLYFNDFFIMYCIVMVYATYNGYYLIRCFHDNFLDRAKYNNVEKWFGMIERAAIVSFFVLENILILLLAYFLIIISRIVFFKLYKEKYALQEDFASWKEFLLTWSVAMLSSSLLLLL